MKLKNIIYLFLVILIIVLAIIASLENSYKTSKNLLIAYPNLIESFKDIHKIEFSSADKGYKLIRKNNGWIIDDIEFPVSKYKINNFLYTLSELKLIDKKTSEKKYFEKLGLSLPLKKPYNSNYISAYDNGTNVIFSFIIGEKSKVSMENNIHYFRKASSNQSWLFKNNFKFKNDSIFWADTKKLNIRRWRVKAVYVNNLVEKTESFSIKRKSYSDQMFFLENIPKDFDPINQYFANSYGSFLEQANIIEIKKKIDINKKNMIRNIIVSCFDGLIFNINLYKYDNKYLYKIYISSDLKERKELPENGPKIIGIPPMSSYDEVLEEVKSLQFISNFFFILDDDSTENILQNKTNLIAKK